MCRSIFQFIYRRDALDKIVFKIEEMKDVAYFIKLRRCMRCVVLWFVATLANFNWQRAAPYVCNFGCGL